MTALIFLVLTIDEGREDEVRSLLEDLSGLRRSVGFRIPDGGLSVVTGIGSEMWDRLFDGPRPAELHPFVPLDGGRHRAPSTPGDLLFHLRASSTDLCFELAAKINDRLRGAATVVDETHGFRYFERRDLLGFVDGTENPEDEEAVAAALVGDEDPDRSRAHRGQRPRGPVGPVPQLLGGDIGVHSELGKGSRFTLRLVSESLRSGDPHVSEEDEHPVP